MNNKFSPLFLISLCDKLIELLVEKWIVNFPKGTDNSKYKRILDYYSQLK